MGPHQSLAHSPVCPPAHVQEEVVASSLEKRCTAADEKAYVNMVGGLDGLSPLGLAYVPDQWPDGRPKDICGWQVGFVGWKRSLLQVVKAESGLP